jgi:uncharacterized membrane protein
VILAYAGSAVSLFTLLIFVSVGMQFFFELRESYMLNNGGLINISIRYISYVFAAVLLYTLYSYSRDKMLTDLVPPAKLKMGYDGVVYGTILIVASCELVNLMGQFYIPDAYKLGLSVLWGIYALALIVLGIAWNKKHLRIGAIVLLAVTLAKLFLYDIAELDTIPKTILFMTLGITMLVVSFLYNKYKSVIFPIQDETED